MRTILKAGLKLWFWTSSTPFQVDKRSSPFWENYNPELIQWCQEKLGNQGSNFFGAYHPFEYVTRNFLEGMKLIDFLPQGARDANQDIYLFAKL